MKVLLLLAFSSVALAQKGDVSAPQKVTAAPMKADSKPAPSTDKRVLHLDLKK